MSLAGWEGRQKALLKLGDNLRLRHARTSPSVHHMSFQVHFSTPPRDHLRYFQQLNIRQSRKFAFLKGLLHDKSTGATHNGQKSHVVSIRHPGYTQQVLLDQEFFLFFFTFTILLYYFGWHFLNIVERREEKWMGTSVIKCPVAKNRFVWSHRIRTMILVGCHGSCY
ncbi:hypothetical protein CEXT_326481 [Caerostris extrusa]|uniref:Uncharacterized protein n=1 Tax=Caerostris extrusa TaxID=172846 RepID=A0AAV4NIJ2_CAEEX|nr:hypothetical protein CEXT_326481 [Caerostris extrusa]